jgi:DNA-binding protein
MPDGGANNLPEPIAEVRDIKIEAEVLTGGSGQSTSVSSIEISVSR